AAPRRSHIPFGGSHVNAAFLLVTTAWLTGADPVPKAAPAPPAAPAPYAPHGPYAAYGSSGCNGGCGATCWEDECGGGGWLGRLRGMFRRNDGCCDSGCDSCDHGGREGFLSRMRGMVRRNDGC